MGWHVEAQPPPLCPAASHPRHHCICGSSSWGEDLALIEWWLSQDPGGRLVRVVQPQVRMTPLRPWNMVLYTQGTSPAGRQGSSALPVYSLAD